MYFLLILKICKNNTNYSNITEKCQVIGKIFKDNGGLQIVSGQKTKDNVFLNLRNVETQNLRIFIF